MPATPAILLVEDEEGACRMIEMILQRKGFEVHAAAGAKSALEKARERRFDLALVDIKLPDGQGVELVRPLQELHPEIQVVIMTAYASVETAVRALNDGVWAYTTKPLNMPEVLRILENALEHKRLVRDNRRLLDNLRAELAERRAVEAELAESNALLERIFDTTFTLFAYLDDDLRFVRVNRAFTKAAGRPDREVVGSTPSEQGMSAETEAMLSRCLAAGRRVSGLKERGLFGEKDDRVWEGSCHPVREPDGTIEGVLLCLEDVTEEEKARERIADYQRQLRTLASRMALAEERDRRRMAERLHEQIGQLLALAKISLLGLKEKLDGDAHQEEAIQVAGVLEETIARTRRLTTELSPPLLFELGLEAALKKLAEEFSARGKPKVAFRADEAVKSLNEDVKIVLYRAVRELLANAAEHSGADEAVVSLERLGDALRVTVSDNGEGFDTQRYFERPNGRRGFGLFNIRERIESLGGEFQVASRPGEGVQASMIVGVEPAHAGTGDRERSAQ